MKCCVLYKFPTHILWRQIFTIYILGNIMATVSALRHYSAGISTKYLPDNAASVVTGSATSPTPPFAGRVATATGGDVDLAAVSWGGARQRFLRRRQRRDDAADPDDAHLRSCRNFTEGNPANNTFYSPNFPANYLSSTDCVRVIEAPKGKLLKLDFRGAFEIEPTNDCKFDYLEIRDGAHGFSNHKGNFCGTDHPPIIISSDRFLWLRFHSDDNFEMSGFTAVYEFIERPSAPPEVDMCQVNVGGNEGFANKTDIPDERVKFSVAHSIPLDCMWVITVQEGWKIQLSFLEFKLEKPNDCDNNYVDVFSDKTEIPNREKNFCGSIADAVTSKNNIMFIRFFADPQAINSSFVALFTAFRERTATQSCVADEYDCQDNTCIHEDLKCNSRINCRYRWDEADCATKKAIASEHIIIIMVIFCLIVSGMCAAMIFNCVRKLMRDHRLIQEHLRQSRENRLDETGNPKKKHSSKDDLKKSTISLIVPPTTVAMPMPMLPPPQLPTHRSRSNSTQSSGSQRFHNNGHEHQCYVPTGLGGSGAVAGAGAGGGGMRQDLIPILKENSTGTLDSNNGCDELMDPGPEMCDSACQTRESLFQTGSRHPTLSNNNSMGSVHQPYGWKSPTGSALNTQTSSVNSECNHPPYRAEVAIEVKEKHQSPPVRRPPAPPRPYSVQTTKSAPDVIVTH